MASNQAKSNIAAISICPLVPCSRIIAMRGFSHPCSVCSRMISQAGC